MIFEMAGLSDIGQLRDHNEDDLEVLADLSVAIVADGMGGHQAGEVASGIAVEFIREQLAAAKDPLATEEHCARALDDAVRAANARTLQVATERNECFGMGSTVVAACFGADFFCAVHLGDSRLYRLREGVLEQLTVDHSVVQELVREGLLSQEEADISLNKNLITRALGIDEHPEPETTCAKIQPGDLYLLGSDGLSDVVPKESIAETLTQGEDLDPLCRELVDLANATGGPDNISVVLVRCTADA